jgi:hypothetical protein
MELLQWKMGNGAKVASFFTSNGSNSRKVTLPPQPYLKKNHLTGSKRGGQRILRSGLLNMVWFFFFYSLITSLSSAEYVTTVVILTMLTNWIRVITFFHSVFIIKDFRNHYITGKKPYSQLLTDSKIFHLLAKFDKTMYGIYGYIYKRFFMWTSSQIDNIMLHRNAKMH